MADKQPDSPLLRLRRQLDQLIPEAPELAAAATRLLDLMERYRRQLESPEFRATLLSRQGQPQTPGDDFKLLDQGLRDSDCREDEEL
jgi:hypothetical protein